jgi:ubiquinone/menaquinone biosynthesis C-methylase UbiE
MKLETFHDLLRMAGGFQPAKIFLTANDLDLFTHLHQERSAAELAALLEVQERGLKILLDALVAMDLLTKQNGRYGNGALAQTYLSGDAAYRGHIFKHLHHCWSAWNELESVLRRGHQAKTMEQEFLEDSAYWNHVFISAMDDVTWELAPQVVAQLDLHEAGCLMDLGGGPGTYAAAFLEQFPQLREVRLFDLPQTLKVAREKLAARGLLDRVQLVSGDCTRDELGQGLDAVWISQLLHSQDDDSCRQILGKVFRALNPGGQVLIHEFFLDEERTSPLRPAIFSVHMLVMTEGGRSYSHGEAAGWLKDLGFENVAWRRVSDDTGVVMGRKPS